jgi:hypothetical protein
MVPVQLGGAGGDLLPFRVFTDAKGNFRRAEYAEDGTADLEWSSSEITKSMEARDEVIVGFPSAAPTVAWQSILMKVGTHVAVNQIRRININFVTLKRMDGPPQPVFIVNEFGAWDRMPTRLPKVPKWGRARLIYGADGSFVLLDNCL